MTEKTAGDEVYIKLQKFLDGMATGFTATESDADIELLKWMFKPEEAEVEIHMRAVPEPADVIAKRCGKPEAEVEEILESMVKRGLVFPYPMKKQKLYMAMNFVPGIVENMPKRMDKESAQLAERYLEDSGFLQTATDQKQMRVVPVGAAVDTTSAVATYDRIRDMVKEQELISVTPCPCREKKGFLGEPCDRPIDNELAFGTAARYRIDNDFGREIGVEEALKIIDEAEESALVITPLNTQEAFAMCLCCGCCCDFLRGLKTFDRPADHVQSSFQARIDPDLCTACGICLERCQMDAIIENEVMEIDLARCIGCGLCLSTCPEEAVSMTPKLGVQEPPLTILSLLAGIAAKRGLPSGNMERFVRKTSMASNARTWEVLYRLRLAKPIINRLAKKGYV